MVLPFAGKVYVVYVVVAFAALAVAAVVVASARQLCKSTHRKEVKAAAGIDLPPYFF